MLRESPTFTSVEPVYPTTSDIAIYPNPTTGVLNIDLGKETIGKVELINILGEKVKSIHIENQQKLQMDMSGLSPGIYFLNIQTETEIATIKVIKQ